MINIRARRLGELLERAAPQFIGELLQARRRFGGQFFRAGRILKERRLLAALVTAQIGHTRRRVIAQVGAEKVGELLEAIERNQAVFLQFDRFIVARDNPQPQQFLQHGVRMKILGHGLRQRFERDCAAVLTAHRQPLWPAAIVAAVRLGEPASGEFRGN